MCRVVHVFLNEKLRFVGSSFYGLRITSIGMVFSEKKYDEGWPKLVMVAQVLGVFHSVILAVVLYPLGVLYAYGLFITTGLSVWRIKQRDYGQSGGDTNANLAPALNLLYLLAYIQGLLYCYSLIISFAAKRLAGKVAKAYGFEKEDHAGRASVMQYLYHMKDGCKKDPSFASGRTLVTFAFELMQPESTSSDYFASGVRILDKILQEDKLGPGRPAQLIRQLVGSASSSQVMHKLLHTFRTTGPHTMDVREHAARIVAHLAGDIELATFPQGTRCICSLLEMPSTSEQEDDDSAPAAHYRELMVQGLVILHKLVADEHNRRIINSAPELLSKAMAPVSADLIHRIDHKAWSKIVTASLQLMSRLVTAPGETGANLRSQVFNNKDAINTMEKILKCDECNEELYILAFNILTQLPMAANASSSMSTDESREKFINTLVAIFTDQTKDASMRQMAAEALTMLSHQGERNATIIFKANKTIVSELEWIITTTMKTGYLKGYTISVAEILENLYIRYTKDNDHLKKLTEAMNDVLPKLLKQILLLPWKEKRAEEETEGDRLSAQNADIESQRFVALHDKQNEDVKERKVDRKLYAALLSLSVTIFGKLITNHKDLDQLADKIAPGDSAFSIAGKLKEVVEGNSEQATASRLRILKIATRMTILLINLEGGRVGADLESLMQSLSKASKNMFQMEGFMILSRSHDSPSTDPANNLDSLVKNAQELLEKKKQEAQNLSTTPVV
ncbi:hypothetical protein GUJ93_ZPchr0009g1257 [Zizania palustris]|uniref:Uncharacterized protein n=1 Tax=Zizania palustris TaxID=103762 RepID=A0A8J5RMP2_ZIZPA|nr:hypothetical protein GUJ93_ZPchr0009g1257 [Zizania palustris]